MTPQRALRTSLALLAVVATLFLGTGAGAQESPDYTAPAPATVVSTPVQPVQSTPAAATPVARSGGLALTGSDAVQLLVVGGVLVAGGSALLVARRRATT